MRDVAGASPSGLGAVDKAVEAVNTLKVLGSLSKMADLLKASAAAAAAALGSCPAAGAMPALVGERLVGDGVFAG